MALLEKNKSLDHIDGLAMCATKDEGIHLDPLVQSKVFNKTRVPDDPTFGQWIDERKGLETGHQGKRKKLKTRDKNRDNDRDNRVGEY